MHVAMLGTRGVPARYGGFETAIEEIGSRLVEMGHRVTVYCRNEGQTITRHRGMHLVNLPAMRTKALETLSHTGLSVAHAVRRENRPTVAVVFNAGNSPYLSILAQVGVPVAVHVDGLEWKRAKWAGRGARYYKWAEATAARSGAALIADANGIAEYLLQEYGRPSYVISYGAPILSPGDGLLEGLDLRPGEYHLVVARMEPENHVDLIVEGYRRSKSQYPLVVVGTAPYGDAYARRVQELAAGVDARLLGGVWDQQLLNQLYANARSYLHGHSVGGTNPSLLRAMGCGAPITAYDISFNHEVTDGNALFFSDPSTVADALRHDDASYAAARARGKRAQERAAASYRWDDVAVKYELMLREIASTRQDEGNLDAFVPNGTAR